MRYWGYPESYSWENMPNIITEDTFDPDGGILISSLMYDIGVALNMDYSCSGSSAYTSDVPSVLKNIFGYSTNSSYINFDSEKVLQQLDYWHYPVIMRGEDLSAGGHAWVCDGYQQTKYIDIHNPDTNYEYETATCGPLFFHMNWGWNGSANGWYRCNDFAPSIYDFSDDLKCIIFIHP